MKKVTMIACAVLALAGCTTYEGAPGYEEEAGYTTGGGMSTRAGSDFFRGEGWRSREFMGELPPQAPPIMRDAEEPFARPD